MTDYDFGPLYAMGWAGVFLYAMRLIAVKTTIFKRMMALIKKKVLKRNPSPEPEINEAYVFEWWLAHPQLNQHCPSRPHAQEARDKAARLLWDHLDERQRAQLRNKGYFEIKAKKGRYRIWAGWSQNLQVCRNGERGEHWHGLPCAIIEPPPPMGDLLLAQKMMIESGEIAHFYGW